MSDDDLLRDSLARIGDRAEPADLLERSLARSRRIGRNQAVMTSAAALVALALAGGLAWQLNRPADRAPAPVADPPSTVATSEALSPPPPSSQPASSSPPPPAGVTGALYYSGGMDLYRLNQSTPKKIAGVNAYSANVSPDGTKIAFIDADSVVVTDRDGQHRETMLPGAAMSVGYEPSWSPDSKRLLVAKITGEHQTALGLLTIATKTFTPLTHQLDSYVHPIWTADGKHIAYATVTCQLATADIDGSNAKLVPNYGSARGRRSCDPYSANRDGTLIAVNQRTGDEPDGDIGRDSVADAVVDTRTGNNVSLPVTGTVTAIMFLPSDEILVRTAGKLTLLAADRTVKAQITEPAGVKSYRLISYIED